MEKIEIKQMLREMGLNPTLTEMPCVIQPLYQKCEDKTPDKIKSAGEIQVGENGDSCKIYGRSISLEKDGTATITGETEYDSYKIKTNKFGIETSYEDGHPLYFSSYISREGGVIDTAFCNNGNGTGVWRKYFDIGSWSIQETKGAQIRGDYGIPLDFDEETVLKEFDDMASLMIKDYPQTEEWYAETRKQLVEAIAREKEPLPRAHLKTNSLKKHIEDLEYANKCLIEEIRIHAARLKRNLELLETVKNSSVGKVFFKDVLQKYEEVRDKRLKTKKIAKFYRKTNNSLENQKLQDDMAENLSEMEEQELKQLKTKIRSLERKLAFLKVTKKELTARKNRLADRAFFTKQVVDDFNKSSILKKVFFHEAVKKYKQYNEDDIDR